MPKDIIQSISSMPDFDQLVSFQWEKVQTGAQRTQLSNNVVRKDTVGAPKQQTADLK